MFAETTFFLKVILVPSMVCIGGPWICICGALILDKAVADWLTFFIPTMNTKDYNHLIQLARMFQALSNGVTNLKRFYNGNNYIVSTDYDDHIGTQLDNSSLPPQKYFPFPHTSDKNFCIVKYARIYGDICAEFGFSPKLFSVEYDLIPNMVMVI